MNLQYTGIERGFLVREEDQVPYLYNPELEETEMVRHGFSTKLGGVSKGCWASMNLSTSRGDSLEAVRENQRRMAKALGVEVANMVYTDQIHETKVERVGKKDGGSCIPNTDGLITNEVGVCLVTFFADCVPLYFLDKKNKAIGLSHSGWRGTVAQMGKKTIERMQEEFGTQPEDVLAVIGPSICGNCYEVSQDVRKKFQEVFSDEEVAVIFEEKENQKYQLNLWKANALVLERAGLNESQIVLPGLCTHCNSEYLFSHRKTGEKRGNLSAFLALK